MECEKCKKWFENPLELYNGEWACPHCHENLSLNSLTLKVTDENEDVFKMSEICYLRALKSQKDKKTYDDLLSRAISFCKDAAHSGHPKALVRLGYLYDSGYFSVDETDAFKLAYGYYRAVWSGKINDMRGDKLNTDYEDGGLKVKKSAARLYLNLLKNAPLKLRAYPRYRYETELAAIKNEGLFEGTESADNGVSGTDRTARIFDILQSCFSKERAPLFGLLSLDAAEFLSLAAVGETAKNGTRKKLLHIAEKVTLRLFNATDGRFRSIKSANDLLNVPDGKYVLYFFNTNGKHIMSGGKINAVRRALEKGDAVTDCVKITELISLTGEGYDYEDYIFSDDDILVHKSKAESISHALGDLIKTVQKNIKRGQD